MSQASPRGLDLPALESESWESYPERRLWIAVILFAIEEYREQLVHIRKLWDADGRPVSKQLLLSLRGTKYEMQHAWFGHVCENADIDQSHIVRKVRELDQEFRLDEIKFAASDAGVSRMSVRRMRKRLQYA